MFVSYHARAFSSRWAKIAEVMPGRTAKQCRERYNNHVDPGIKKDKIWTAEEDALVMKLHAEHHNQFAKIARRIPGRCYDDVKNRRVGVPYYSSRAKFRFLLWAGPGMYNTAIHGMILTEHAIAHVALQDIA